MFCTPNGCKMNVFGPAANGKNRPKRAAFFMVFSNMSSNKFPPYFEKYFEQKFGEINTRLSEMQCSVEKYDVRVSALEVWKANIMGRVAIVSFVLVFVVNMAIDWFKKKFEV